MTMPISTKIGAPSTSSTPSPTPNTAGRLNQTTEGGTFQAEQLKAESQLRGLEDSVKAATESGDLEALKDVAKQFEEVFINMLFKSMRSTVEDSGLTEKSNDRSIFEGMLDEEFSKNISKAGGVGISEMMVQQLKRYVEAPEAPDQSLTQKSYKPFDSRG